MSGANRSMPDATVIPVLAYDDVDEAADWLCAAFGFERRLNIGEHRVQLAFGGGAVVATDAGAGPTGLSVLVRVEDANAHCARAEKAGARIVSPPTDYPYGERQYTAEDLAGHRWTFSQTVADVDPAEWGGVLVAKDQTSA
jgi:uncharacterized glyoxalase superfamily protein PhnB